VATSYGCPRGRKMAEKGSEKKDYLNEKIFSAIKIF
jgi:hypothetical protein